MRSSRALHIISRSRRPLVQRQNTSLLFLRNGYCSVCDATKPGPTGTAKAVKNPPIPPADHRQLGIEQELFINSKYSPGSPLFTPNGTRMFTKLTNFLRAQYSQFGFEEVITPTIYKKSLWEKSGHWENYKDDMYSVTGRGATGERKGKEIEEDEEYGLKPMNCPGHCLIFGSKGRSYREMPVRYADFSPLHRNEVSGSLSGLTRVRRFHQDDGHIFCRPSQIGDEISQSLEFVRMAYQTLGLGPYRLTLSTRPKDSYIGTIEEWDNAEAALRKSLDESGQVWTVNEGDGAFYGPKIDIILKDSDGKEHQTATIQLDFQLPKRFELEYQAPAPELEKKGETTTDPDLLAVSGPVTPVLIHRAVLGSVERLMALLIEHYNGKYPFWLNPRQAIVITVNDEEPVVEYAKSLIRHLKKDAPFTGIPTTVHRADIPTPDGLPWARRREAHSFSIDLDDSPRSVSKKISEAKRNRYGVIMVVGRRDVKAGSVSVDLSGIPDPHGWLLVSVNGSASEVIDPRGNAAKKKSEARPVPDLEVRDIKPEQLGDLSFGWGGLRTLFSAMNDRYI
jgi:threonyl-tRNA synthetase